MTMKREGGKRMKQDEVRSGTRARQARINYVRRVAGGCFRGREIKRKTELGIGMRIKMMEVANSGWLSTFSFLHPRQSHQNCEAVTLVSFRGV